MGHIVLLGDSIFDNERYVAGGPPVAEHLKRILPIDWRGTLLARDGAIAEGVARQLVGLPEDATHLVVSVGGNNAIEHSAVILNESANSFHEVLSTLSDILTDFQIEYHEMLAGVMSKRKPVIVCTIYDAIPIIDRSERTGLRLFNDVILREAIRARVPVIDLRQVCSESSDYAESSPIEPSVTGGAKIARAIWHAIEDEPDTLNRCQVFA